MNAGNNIGLADIAAQVGANLSKGANVATIAMPLVRLMRDGDLSWSDQMEVAGVIRQLLNAKKSMDDERRHIFGAAAQQTRSQGNSKADDWTQK